MPGATIFGVRVPASRSQPSGPVVRPDQIGPPSRQLPNPARRTTLGSTGDVRRPPNEPFLIPVEVSVASQLAFHALRAFGDEPGPGQAAHPGVQQQPPDGALTIDPNLGRTPLSPEETQREWRIERQRQNLRDFFGPIGEFLVGAGEGAGLEKTGGGGFFLKKLRANLGKFLLGASPLGSGEEEAVIRQLEAERERALRGRLAFERAAGAALFAARLLAQSGGEVEMLPMWETDP